MKAALVGYMTFYCFLLEYNIFTLLLYFNKMKNNVYLIGNGFLGVHYINIK